MARPNLSYLKSLLLGFATAVFSLLRNPVRGLSGLAVGAWSGLKGRKLTSLVLVVIIRNAVLALLGFGVGAWSGFTGMGAGPLLTPISQWLLGLKDQRLSSLVLAVTVISALIGLEPYAHIHGALFVDAIFFAILSILGATIAASSIFEGIRNTRQADLFWAVMILLLSLWMVHNSRSIGSIHATTLNISVLALSGFFAGFLGRIANMGGALAVPVLILIYGDAPLIAQATALIILILVTTPPTLAYTARRELPTSTVLWIGIGAAIGALVGGRAAVHAIPALLVEVYGIGLFCLGFYRLFLNWSMRPSDKS